MSSKKNHYKVVCPFAIDYQCPRLWPLCIMSLMTQIFYCIVVNLLILALIFFIDAAPPQSKIHINIKYIVYIKYWFFLQNRHRARNRGHPQDPGQAELPVQDTWCARVRGSTQARHGGSITCCQYRRNGGEDHGRWNHSGTDMICY